MLRASYRKMASVLIAGTALVCFANCSDSEPAKVSGLAIDDGASLGAQTSMLVTPEQEATLELKTGARLTIPQGAVKGNVEVVMKRPADKQAAELVKSLSSKQQLASAPYVLTPHGTTFNKDVELKLPVAKGQPEKLVVAWLENERDTSWKILGKPSISGGTATYKVQHFSVLVLLEIDDTADLDASTPDVERPVEPSPEPAEAGAGDGGKLSAEDASDVLPDIRSDAGGSAYVDAGIGAGPVDATTADAGADGEPDASPVITCQQQLDYGNCAPGYSFCAGPYTTYVCSDGHTYSWNFGRVVDGSCELQCQIDGQLVGPTCTYAAHVCDSSDPLVVCALDCGFPSFVGAQVLDDGKTQTADAGTDAGADDAGDDAGPDEAGAADGSVADAGL